MPEITKEDVEKSKAAQQSVFKSPELLEQANAISDMFSEPNADGTKLLNMLRDLLIRQGEWDFEQEVKEHPHGLQIKQLGKTVEDKEIKDWLELRLKPEDFILMPQNAQGKYKDRWNWVYFKEKDQAMLFKLTWF